MYPDEEDFQAAVKTDSASVLVLGNRVYDASSLVPTVVHFTRQQYLFLNAYRLGVPLVDAASKAGMEPAVAERFLARPKTVEWLQDRAVKDHIRTEWQEPGKWWQKGDEWMNASSPPSKNQVEIWKEFGKRVQPCSEGQAAQTRIEINIDAGALERSKERRKSIDAQIESDESNAL